MVTVKKNREMQNKDGTTMERAEMKKKRKYGRDQIKHLPRTRSFNLISFYCRISFYCKVYT
jgi:hypothetical protein